jgi:hypothetical protein
MPGAGAIHPICFALESRPIPSVSLGRFIANFVEKLVAYAIGGG